MSNIQAIYDWLLQQQVKVSMEWLEACLDWVSNESNQRPLNRQRLQRQVYEQWLLTDLCELGQQALPVQVKSEKYTLNGRYCLQINSIINTAQSYYSQLLDVRGENNANTSVTAETQQSQFTQKFNANSSSSSSRLLMMDVTDGNIQLSAMEYRPINCLNTKTTPGTKIRIKGPILCRRGVLMLHGSNVQLLGGESDSAASNTPEAVLCQALDMPVPTAPAAEANAEREEVSEEFGDELPPDILDQLDDIENGFHSDQPLHQPTTAGGCQLLSFPSSSSTNNNIADSSVTNGSVSIQSNVDSRTTSDRHSSSENISNAIASNVGSFLGDEDFFASDDFLVEPDASRVDDTTPSHQRLSYLCQIKKQGVAGRFVIKAFVLTLLSKLKSSDEGEWSLGARICDGSDYLDVNFSDEFLTSHIGFTCVQAKEIRRGNTSQMDALKRGMGKCRRFIIEFCQLVSVDYEPDATSTVTQVVQPTSNSFPYF